MKQRTVGNGLLHLVFLTRNSLLSTIFIHSTKKRADLHTFRYFVYTLNQSIIWIDKFSFLEEKISGQHIFKLPEMPKNHVFVSDKFRNLVIDNGIIGWEFIEEWDSEK
ncbi:imm11 family protein [Brevibacillus laterosporus]|uniref:imm11 family protein n=3 Tax=Brevibacillus laterosporus TaxID=1465 RepID=UPI0030834EEF